MNILVTGANGQLGNEMRVIAQDSGNHSWFFTDVQELDITDRSAVAAFVKDNNIDAVVNCAAYTNVDRAERDEQTAYLLNALAAENLAVVAHEAGALLVHISTDYVFDGNACLPYRETDTPNPQTAYGRTKLAGERLIQQACPSAVIIRTAWLYSSFGNNFVKTMLRLGKERDSLSVVYDQIGTPTYAADLAFAILCIIENSKTLEQTSDNIYHFTNLGVCSWYDFTCEIHRLAGISCKVSPIRSEQYPQPTPRPHYSVLDKQKIQSAFGIRIPHWTDSLARCLKLMDL
ncbi:MAG: dTDP-4-dehydrorhamnose reductase [Paludibacteraceae bacterium]|nr:dTDP-4-dehydrorhamnose reductase [Paludibacteraceae bacterium]